MYYREGTAIFAAKKKEYIDLDARIIVSSCPSCISKIKKEMGDGVRVCHPVEIIDDLIKRRNLDGK